AGVQLGKEGVAVAGAGQPNRAERVEEAGREVGRAREVAGNDDVAAVAAGDADASVTAGAAHPDRPDEGPAGVQFRDKGVAGPGAGQGERAGPRVEVGRALKPT